MEGKHNILVLLGKDAKGNTHREEDFWQFKDDDEKDGWIWMDGWELCRT